MVDVSTRPGQLIRYADRDNRYDHANGSSDHHNGNNGHIINIRDNKVRAIVFLVLLFTLLFGCNYV